MRGGVVRSRVPGAGTLGRAVAAARADGRATAGPARLVLDRLGAKLGFKVGLTLDARGGTGDGVRPRPQPARGSDSGSEARSGSTARPRGGSTGSGRERRRDGTTRSASSAEGLQAQSAARPGALGAAEGQVDLGRVLLRRGRGGGAAQVRWRGLGRLGAIAASRGATSRRAGFFQPMRSSKSGSLRVDGRRLVVRLGRRGRDGLGLGLEAAGGRRGAWGRPAWGAAGLPTPRRALRQSDARCYGRGGPSPSGRGARDRGPGLRGRGPRGGRSRSSPGSRAGRGSRALSRGAASASSPSWRR